MSEQTTIRHIFYDWCKETNLEPTEARFEAFENGYARAGRSPAPEEGEETIAYYKMRLEAAHEALEIMRGNAEDAGMSDHPKLPDIVAAMKWLDAFDSCVYSGPEWAAEHARTIKAEIERLRSPAPAEGGEGLREALKQIALITASGRTTELLAKMAQVNALARAALSSGRDGRKT